MSNHPPDREDKEKEPDQMEENQALQQDTKEQHQDPTHTPQRDNQRIPRERRGITNYPF